MLTEKDLANMERRAKNASPSWRVGRHIGRTLYSGDTLIGCMDTMDDAYFIAHARDDVPALIAEVRVLRLHIANLEAGGSA